MTGETDLSTLLAGMAPALSQDEYVFVSSPNWTYGDGSKLNPIAAVMEAEGLTLIVPRERAEGAGLAYDGVFQRITLGVHSSLEAVGLTAAVAARLAERGISANVLAGFYHDHIFVQSDRAADAMAAL